MKKSIFMAAAAALMVFMGACSTKECQKGADCTKADKEEVYTGVLPAADCDGVRYTLHMDFDDEDNDGDYKLVETYLAADSTSAMGYKDVKTFKSEGDFTIEKQGDKTYYKLVKDVKDSMEGSADTPMYFVVDSDSTITMTNQNLEVSETPGMNYTLTVAK